MYEVGMASQNNDEDNEIYIPETGEELLYEQAIRRLRVEVNKGKTYAQACQALSDDEKHLQTEIREDFLKVIIAERHFGDGYGIDDIALLLDISYEQIEKIRDYMLRDLGNAFNRERKWPDSDMSH